MVGDDRHTTDALTPGKLPLISNLAAVLDVAEIRIVLLLQNSKSDPSGVQSVAV